MSKPIEWTQKAVPLAELAPYYKNPRKIGGKKLDDLRESVGKFGYAEPLVANVDGTLIGGHARLTVAAADGLESVPVNYPSRKLTDKEVEELNIRLNKNVAGEWDWDILMADFDTGDLESWGFDVGELGVVETISEEDAFSGVGMEEKDVGQMTFTIHVSQKNEVLSALDRASTLADFTESPNSNKNGNCLAFICETFNTVKGIE